MQEKQTTIKSQDQIQMISFQLIVKNIHISNIEIYLLSTMIYDINISSATNQVNFQ
jgi:hypothetical protein